MLRFDVHWLDRKVKIYEEMLVQNLKINADLEVAIKARTNWLDCNAPVIAALRVWGAAACPPWAPLTSVLQCSWRQRLRSDPPRPPREQSVLRCWIYCLKRWWVMRMPVCSILRGQLSSYIPFMARCVAERQGLHKPISVPSTAEGLPWELQAATSSRWCWGSAWQSVCVRARRTSTHMHVHSSNSEVLAMTVHGRQTARDMLRFWN